MEFGSLNVTFAKFLANGTNSVITRGTKVNINQVQTLEISWPTTDRGYYNSSAPPQSWQQRFINVFFVFVLLRRALRPWPFRGTRWSRP